jgi:hypothetical protein
MAKGRKFEHTAIARVKASANIARAIRKAVFMLTTTDEKMCVCGHRQSDHQFHGSDHLHKMSWHPQSACFGGERCGCHEFGEKAS